MAETLEVSNEAPASVDLSEHDQQMLDKAEGVQTDPVSDIPAGQHKETKPEVEDKFGGDYNKLMASYQELERKQSQTAKPESEDLSIPKEEAPQSTAIDMEALTNEYRQNGSLSEDSMKLLENNGISREMTNQYIAGQLALAQQVGNSVKATVGGNEAYSEMTEWAKANYTEQQIASYDQAVNSGDINLATMAAKGLMADYQAANGSEGQTYGGERTAGPGDVTDTYTSNAQLTADMKDPRYETDLAFQKAVADKLARSNLFGTKTI